MDSLSLLGSLSLTHTSLPSLRTNGQSRRGYGLDCRKCFSSPPNPRLFRNPSPIWAICDAARGGAGGRNGGGGGGGGEGEGGEVGPGDSQTNSNNLLRHGHPPQEEEEGENRNPNQNQNRTRFIEDPPEMEPNRHILNLLDEAYTFLVDITHEFVAFFHSYLTGRLPLPLINAEGPMEPGYGHRELAKLLIGPFLSLDASQQDCYKFVSGRTMSANDAQSSESGFPSSAPKHFQTQEGDTGSFSSPLSDQRETSIGESLVIASYETGSVKTDMLDHSESHNPVSKGNVKDNANPSLVDREADWLTRFVNLAASKIKHGRPNMVEERKSLVDEIVSLVVEKVLQTNSLAKRFEIDVLKRLQRDAFFELLKIRERTDKVEHLTGLKQRSNSGNGSKGTRTLLKGEVKAGAAFVSLEESSSRHARSSLELAGMQTGLGVKFTFETPFREADFLVTECVAGQSSSVGDGRALGGPLNLSKVQYSAHVNNDFSLAIVPLGAQGKDVTEIVNPLQDQALTEFTSNGPTLFGSCKGSALGVTVHGSNFALSAAQYLSGWSNQISGWISPEGGVGNDPLCLSSLAHFLFQPYERTIFSVAALNRYWPSPPLPSSAGLHWSEIGPLILPKIHTKEVTSNHRYTAANMTVSNNHGLRSTWGGQDMNDHNEVLESKGTTTQFVAVGAEIDLGAQISLGAWAQVERGEWLHDASVGSGNKSTLQWSLSLAKTSGAGLHWGASIGCSKPDFCSLLLSSDPDQNEACGPQLQLEAFLKLQCTSGFYLQPGLLYVINGNLQTPALMLKSTWAI